jgi:hypothetical protein
MPEILWSMIKEEWRLHSVMFGSLMFALFPVMIVIFSLAGSLFLPLFETIVPAGIIVLLAHYLFVLFGLSVGGLGLFSREIMNRRFGQASLIAYSSRNLPVSERKIFLNFFVKDVFYYFLLWIVPFMAGLVIAFPFVGIGPGSLFTLLLTLPLSFLIGLSMMFLLSTLFAHSSRFFAAALVLAALAGFALGGYFNINLLYYLPSLSYFVSRSPYQLALSLLLVAIPSALSIIFVKADFPERKRKYSNALAPLSKKFGFSRNPHLIAKDLLDLQRSEGGPGKIILSFIFPVALIWIILFVFLSIIPLANFLLIFSILMGMIASSVYDWLTEYDSFASYSFLPVRVSTLIRSKISGYAILNQVPLAILVAAAFWTGSVSYLFIGALVFVSVSSYSLAMKVYLTGLYPGVMLYNAKIFAAFLLLGVPVMLALIFLSIFNPAYLLASPILVPLSIWMIRKSSDKWDRAEQPGF